MGKNTDILIKFGKRIKELRFQRGITSQMSLANKAGLDRTYIGGVERGERNVGLKNIEKIAKTLGVRVEELFKF
ncbi:MAG: helix-turn-helix transcriptional regulator [Patescibacteria group bacterium]